VSFFWQAVAVIMKIVPAWGLAGMVSVTALGSRRPVPRKVLDRPIVHHHSNEVFGGLFSLSRASCLPKSAYQPKFPFDE
jgi:hypothetical protein